MFGGLGFYYYICTRKQVQRFSIRGMNLKCAQGSKDLKESRPDNCLNAATHVHYYTCV